MSELMDYYADGAWYDAEYVHMGGDIHYYVGIAAEVEGPILELACGTGRLSIPMAQVGATVHGIDNSRGMILQANRKKAKLPDADQDRLTFALGDMRTVRLERRFDAVVLGFNTLMHMLKDEDLCATLNTAREHLSDDGLFYFDLHTPFPQLPDRDPNGRYDPQEMIETTSGHRYIVTENNRYDPRNQINTVMFFYQRVDREGKPIGAEKRAELELRVIFPRELDHFMKLCGFEVVGDWDDFERSTPFSGNGGRRVISARRRR